MRLETGALSPREALEAEPSYTVSARSLRDPQKRPPQKSLIGIEFLRRRNTKSVPIERI
jgi:hypothetical protein